MWGPGGQPGSSLNHLQGSTSGSVNSTHSAAFNHLVNVAHQLVTCTTARSVIPANINIPQGPANFNQHYTVWYIIDKAVANKIRRILAFAPINICHVANYFLRPRNQSPYDAVFGTSVRNYSPVVARTTVHARQLLTQRPSYLKAFVIHSRSAVNLTSCTNNCAAAIQGKKTFTAFLSCVSISRE
ncbi:hypothetical protein EKO04_007218 [Ascochyta lentis]|uniref:Uncharacterized protein n=1 Tax=Ascochyta lentis TaxID=205686 RepID=A0A8H7MHF2_9PLEO|nr:hypothetical protein EKO04_007218 [Ascochyta lentis]